MSYRSILDQLKAQRDYARSVARQTEALVRRVLPLGSTVWWERGGNIQIGHVAAYGGEDRLKVHNERTGKDVWIDTYTLCNPDGARPDDDEVNAATDRVVSHIHSALETTD